jgi:hypothetical protein
MQSRAVVHRGANPARAVQYAWLTRLEMTDAEEYER